MQQKLLTEMVAQFQARHKTLPAKIVVDPPALIALGVKKSLAPIWNGIPVECRECSPSKLKGAPNILGIHVKTDSKRPTQAFLESFDVYEKVV